ncbi:MAG: ATPase [Candidatus Parabeggiatoa sp. nov. 3]|nr:MAG: ATPase [Gammaproteobacteria bacterium]RKZ66002.1 MAG: ATPase [Gammaproteobacteria bacterium]RKZ85707.1 MAG: ATPase [Gammaproteobacteria bacterium]
MKPIFEFEDNSCLLGQVREVDTRKISLSVNDDKDLRKAKVSQLVTIALSGASRLWLIGNIDKVIKKSISVQTYAKNEESSEEHDNDLGEKIVNSVHLTLVGTVRWNAYESQYLFSRSIQHVPEIESDCYVLRDAQLESFMKILSTQGDKAYSLELGQYTIDESATAYLDGNKLFQRHAAILGSTGSGKSWTVASILERAAKLPSANLVVFDLHGEYRALSYAKHLRIPGPDELGTSNPKGLLYLPYWLLNADEMLAMFIDRSEFSAHNQVMVFQNAVIEQKKTTLADLGKNEVLNAFTLDSPVPFSLKNVIESVRSLNEEMIAGARGLKQGQFFGQFSRLLTRLNSKLSDKRYGFLFNAPSSEHEYDAMANLAANLMDYSQKGGQIKIIDFSEVPADIMPIIVGIVARVIYQIQFWTPHDKRRPLALVCDEAHLYLPKKDDQNPVEKRAVEAFEKIAKEGRKYGVALLVSSQRPSDISPTILSQCNNVIALRLTNGEDQNTVRKLLPETLESLLEILPIMDIGEGLVVGDAVLLPSRIKINPPQEKPLSATIDFWSEWIKKAEKPDFIKAVENMRKQGRR